MAAMAVVIDGAAPFQVVGPLMAAMAVVIDGVALVGVDRVALLGAIPEVAWQELSTQFLAALRGETRQAARALRPR